MNNHMKFPKTIIDVKNILNLETFSLIKPLKFLITYEHECDTYMLKYCKKWQNMAIMANLTIWQKKSEPPCKNLQKRSSTHFAYYKNIDCLS